MEKIVVRGVKELKGEVNISSAKNSILPIIAATILCKEKVVIKETPLLEDVSVFIELLDKLGSKVSFSNITNDLEIDNLNISLNDSIDELVRQMRASFLIMGPLLARIGYCKVSLPGGCNIGNRPIDLHLKGLKALGAKIVTTSGYVEARCDKLKGTSIYLDFPSVGATENIMMAATLAEGRTIIENAAEEPEICDLADFLNKMGAKIKGAGCGKIIIDGVENLKGTVHKPIYDRIEAGTFMVAAAITNSIIKLNGLNEDYLRPIMEKLKECGVKFKMLDNSIIVDGRGEKNPIDIKTLPHPGFPTDMQPQMLTLLSLVKGTSIVTETVFENRFMHVAELTRMGANIKIDGKTAIIDGVDYLTGCEVKATDLRAGAAMILAGLASKGETIISDIYHIDRGYLNIEDKFRKLGADVFRKNI